MDLISFNPRLITENNLHDDNRPYRYGQSIQDQQNLFIHNNNYDEDDNNHEEYMLEKQNENRNGDITPNIKKNNAREYTTPESTTSAQMHHKRRHQQLPNSLEFQLGLLIQDKTHMISNHTQIHLHIVI